MTTAWVVALLMLSGLAVADSHNHPFAAVRLVDIRSISPEIRLDMRYAGSNNFVGARIDGYEAARCYLLRPVAEALARVEVELRKQQRRLVIFDCYRPRRAVAHFMRWTRDLDDEATKAAYYPRLAKSALVPDYIAARSGHSRADTVDLTLMQCDAALKACVAVDMGTPFDFFDPKANTEHPNVTENQRANRLALRTAMMGQGFSNYALEWWHYSLRDADAPVVTFDLPIRPDDEH